MESTYIHPTDASDTKPAHWFWRVHLPILAASIVSVWLVDRVARFRMLNGAFQLAAFLSCCFVITAAIVALFFDLRQGWSSRATKAVFYSLLAAPLVLMSVLVLNGGLDASEASPHSTTVVAKSSACGFPRPRCIYTVELVSWRDPAGTERLHINESSFGKLKVGQRVTVVTHKGWLGITWIQSVAFLALDQGSITESQPAKVDPTPNAYVVSANRSLHQAIQ